MENDGCDGLTALRKLPAYDRRPTRSSTRYEKMAFAGGRKDSE
jgi:hypothetical protein